MFGKRETGASYRRFVERGIDETTRSFYQDSRLPAVVGGDGFREWVQSSIDAGDLFDHPEIPAVRRVRRAVDLTRLGEAVCIAFAVGSSELRRVAPGPGREPAKARAAFVYLARLEGGHTLETIASWLGYRRYGSAAGALHRLRRDLASDASLRRRLDVARRLLINKKT